MNLPQLLLAIASVALLGAVLWWLTRPTAFICYRCGRLFHVSTGDEIQPEDDNSLVLTTTLCDECIEQPLTPARSGDQLSPGAATKPNA